MTDQFESKLTALGFALPEGHQPPSAELVRQFEFHFDLTLPDDFRSFLSRFGGYGGTAMCPTLEPTPFGDKTVIDIFYGFERDEIVSTTELIEGAPDIIALGGEPLGRMFWLYCTEPYAGHVFVHDHYNRSSWSDEEFSQWPDLSPEIHRYLDLRRDGQLPPKPEGFEDVYLVAKSFTDFIERLEPYRPG